MCTVITLSKKKKDDEEITKFIHVSLCKKNIFLNLIHIMRIKADAAIVKNFCMNWENSLCCVQCMYTNYFV